MNGYKTTIGIEVHAELKTKSKMFCGCANDPHAGEPNAHICPVCMAHPGTLPVVNKEAVALLMKIGTAVEGELAEYSEFDRKNYFYPDIPKAYQISQYQFPFVSGGSLAGVALTRIHLEEDTARSQHDDVAGKSYVDYNRAGVPLMELVTEPVIHDAETAGKFARELQLLLRTLEASDANMERGEMRVEANISVSKTEELGTKVEVKNLNSFKSVESAIDFEVKRQIELIEKGERVVQETRGWDENRSKTFSQRVKESADDYRYFPDPDIPKFKRSEVPEFTNASLSEISVETPENKRVFYRDIGLTSEQIEVIIAEKQRDVFMKSTLDKLSSEQESVAAANYFTSDVLGLSEAEKLDLTGAHSDAYAGLIKLTVAGDLNSRVAKDLLKEVVFDGLDAAKIAEERGLLQKNNADDLIPIVETILAENEAAVADYKAGKESSLKYLLGQGMKVTKGSANPAVLTELIKKQLDA